ncbi:MAG TPA: 4a-hydroxytetrahydrobiopterin dehydratase [Saprospiraceae bacterium]|nr:4a-hydroxytetrahydrobiopterin dehydratase [Saprospiraceae bacterium]
MWKEVDNHLEKSFKLKDFKQAMAFLQLIAFEAEALNHHPDIHNEYNKVDIQLSTHSEGNKVTEKDRELSKKIDAVFTLFSK